MYTTKIIKNDSVVDLPYNNESSYNWENSNIKKYLDKDYKLYQSEYLTNLTYKQEYLKDNKFANFDNQVNSNISILSLSDFINSSMCSDLTITSSTDECLKNNWLNIPSSLGEWTLTAKYEEQAISEKENTLEDTTVKDISEVTKELPINNKVFTIGNSITPSVVTESHIFRPVVFLKNRIITVSGDGTLDNPYIIR